MSAVTIEAAGAAVAAANAVLKGEADLGSQLATIHEAVNVEGLSRRAIGKAAGCSHVNVGYWAAVALIAAETPEVLVWRGGPLNVYRMVRVIGVPTTLAAVDDDSDTKTQRNLQAALDAKAAAKAEAKAEETPAKAEAPAPTPGQVTLGMSPAEVREVIAGRDSFDAEFGKGLDAWLADATETAKVANTVRAGIDAKSGTDRKVSKGAKSLVKAA